MLSLARLPLRAFFLPSLNRLIALSSRTPLHPAITTWLITFHIHSQAHTHALFGVFVSIALIFYKNKFLWLSIIKYPNAINNNPSYLHNKYPKLLSSHRNNTAMRQPSRARLRSGCFFNNQNIASEVERRDSRNSVPWRFPALMGVGSSNGTTGKRRTMSGAGLPAALCEGLTVNKQRGGEGVILA